MNRSNTNTADLSAVFVIFGGTGDLTHRKLMPALYNLVYDRLLPENFAVVAIGRRDQTSEKYREGVRRSLESFSRNKIDEACWEKLASILYYYQFDFREEQSYGAVKAFVEEIDQKHGVGGNRIFYMAVAPEYFETIIRGLQNGGLSRSEQNWNRLVIEKPFGKDLKTAQRLNRILNEVFDESSIYRIDHYLGKEMIQNLLVLRFCNMVFESLWNNKYIDNIQISLLEEHSVGSRGDYYESSGAIRDMVQSHLIQVLSLVAMEPPVNLNMDSIRTEKLKVVQAFEDFTAEKLRDNVVFGQYGKGYKNGKSVKAYREEDKVAEGSNTETYVAMKLHINNLRWSGTPFYIRTGKALGSASSEIVIQFKKMPDILYYSHDLQVPNLLVIRIQPHVGVFFQFNTRGLDRSNAIVANKMDSCQIDPMQGNTPEAYERLIYEVLRGDAALFSRWDEVEASWIFADKIIAHRENGRFNFPNYEAGSMGPAKAYELLARENREWWSI